MPTSTTTHATEICGLAATVLAGLCSWLTYLLRKKEIELTKLKTRETQEAKAEFSDLVVRLYKKINSFWTFMLGRTGGAEKIARPSDTEPYGATHYVQYGSSDISLFSVRAAHYTEEKFAICKRLLHELVHNEKIAKRKSIYLLIDSGSTLFPVFGLLCDYIRNEHEPYASILRKVHIITNNIPGVQVMITRGRKGSYVTADTVLDCIVIPGKVEAKYSAILSQEGINHVAYVLKKVRERENDVIVVALLTGNYISIGDGILWRGSFHGQMKNALAHCADSIYLLSPLGKVFNKTAGRINIINRESRYPMVTSKEYKTLVDPEAQLRNEDCHYIGIDPARHAFPSIIGDTVERLLPSVLVKEKEVFLVTTNRSGREKGNYPSPLLEHFSRIHSLLKDRFGDYLISDDFSPDLAAAQAICELQMYRDPVHAFLNYEFPHPEIRASMESELFHR
jgi:hypothetical protein